MDDNNEPIVYCIMDDNLNVVQPFPYTKSRKTHSVSSKTS